MLKMVSNRTVSAKHIRNKKSVFSHSKPHQAGCCKFVSNIPNLKGLKKHRDILLFLSLSNYFHDVTFG